MARDTPYRSPTAATPENSDSSAPAVATVSPAADTQPQNRPNVSQISSPWPLPEWIPRRTVSSCVMYRIGISSTWISSSR